MIKQLILLFSLANCAFLSSMDGIKPSSEAPLLLSLAVKDYSVDQKTIDQYAQFELNPTDIISITKYPCPSPDTESYIAKVADGKDITCTYFPSGKFAGEIWANRSLSSSISFPELPINQKIFFILKAHFEGQKK